MKDAPRKVFLIFLFGGLLITIAVLSVALICNIIWVDFIHENPHRTRAHAASLILLAPFFGLFVAIVLKLFSLPFAAGLASLGRVVLGRLPFWYVIALLPLCVLTDLMQGFLLFGDLGEESPRPLLHLLLIFFAVETPVLLGCWWWVRRQSSTLDTHLNSARWLEASMGPKVDPHLHRTSVDRT